MARLTARERATILQQRCAITVATSGEESGFETFGKKGVIRVGRVESCGKDEYCFDISEEEVAMIRGKPRREMIWSCAVIVSGDDVEVYEERGHEGDVPPGVVECATAPITAADERLVRRGRA